MSIYFIFLPKWQILAKFEFLRCNLIPFNGSDTKKVNDKRHQPFEIETFFVKFERFIETSYLEGENCFGKNALEVGWSQVATR